MDPENNFSCPVLKFKIIFLGDLSVGKTSIITQFIYGTFDSMHQPTIGIDFLSKMMYVNNKSVRLQLWDTAGQERFRALIPSYIRGSQAAIIVYDISNKQSFVNIDKWVTDVRAEHSDDMLIIVVGNKSDLADRRAVTFDEAQAKAQDLSVIFIEVSAKSGDSIDELFKTLVSELSGLQELGAPESDVATQDQFQLQLGVGGAQPQNTTKNGCCRGQLINFANLFHRIQVQMAALLILIPFGSIAQQTFTLRGDIGQLHLETPVGDYYVTNQGDFVFQDSQRDMLTFHDCPNNCEILTSRRMSFDGSFYGSIDAGFNIYGYDQWKLVVSENFEGNVEGWSDQRISSCGTSPDTFLGGACKFGGITVQRQFRLPPHTHLRVQASVHFIDRWEGESLRMKIGGQTVWAYGYTQCQSIIEDSCLTYGINSCGNDFPDRLSYPLEYQGVHSQESVTVEFESNLTRDPCEASWGIDDFEIYVR